MPTIAATTITPQKQPVQTIPPISTSRSALPSKTLTAQQQISPRLPAASRSAKARRTVRPALQQQTVRSTLQQKSSRISHMRTVAHITKRKGLTQGVKPLHKEPLVLDNPQSVRQFIKKLRHQYAQPTQQDSKRAAWNQDDWSKQRAHSRLTDAPEPFLR